MDRDAKQMRLRIRLRKASVLGVVLFATACAAPAHEVAQLTPPPVQASVVQPAGPQYQNESGFAVWFASAPNQMSMTEPGVVSLIGEHQPGVFTVHVHPKRENSDAALRAVADEFLKQWPLAPGQSFRPIKVPGAESAFAITLQIEMMGIALPMELRIARRDGDLAVWAAMGQPGESPTQRFLDSFRFSERGVYVDPFRGFRVAVPQDWEFLPSGEEEAAPLLRRGHRPTRQFFEVRRVDIHSDGVSLDNLAEDIAKATLKEEHSRLLRQSKQIVDGKKTVEVWTQELDNERSFVTGWRFLIFPDHTMVLRVMLPDATAPTALAQQIVDSFQPIAAPADSPSNG